MDDLISRQAAIYAVMNTEALFSVDLIPYQKTSDVIDAINELPSAQPEQKTGRWIFEKGDGETCVDGYICSACGRSYHTKVPYFSEYNFCPNCGAKMEGE